MLEIIDKVKGYRRYLAGLSTAVGLVAQVLGKQVDTVGLLAGLEAVFDGVTLAALGVAGLLALWSKRVPDGTPQA